MENNGIRDVIVDHSITPQTPRPQHNNKAIIRLSNDPSR